MDELDEANEAQQAELFYVIGQNVKYYRRLYCLEKGKMTQENLAEKVDVSTSLIGNLESTHIHQGISIYTLWKISHVLEIPIEKFFEERDSQLKKD